MKRIRELEELLLRAEAAVAVMLVLLMLSLAGYNVLYRNVLVPIQRHYAHSGPPVKKPGPVPDVAAEGKADVAVPDAPAAAGDTGAGGAGAEDFGGFGGDDGGGGEGFGGDLGDDDDAAKAKSDDGGDDFGGDFGGDADAPADAPAEAPADKEEVPTPAKAPEAGDDAGDFGGDADAPADPADEEETPAPAKAPDGGDDAGDFGGDFGDEPKEEDTPAPAKVAADEPDDAGGFGGDFGGDAEPAPGGADGFGGDFGGDVEAKPAAGDDGFGGDFGGGPAAAPGGAEGFGGDAAAEDEDEDLSFDSESADDDDEFANLPMIDAKNPEAVDEGPQGGPPPPGSFAAWVVKVVDDLKVDWIDVFLRQLVIIVSFLGAMIATHRRKHINIDALSKVLSAAAQRWVSVLMNVVAISVCLLLAKAGSDLVALGQEYESDVVPWAKEWQFQLMFPVGFSLMALHFGFRLLEGLVGQEPPAAPSKPAAEAVAADVDEGRASVGAAAEPDDSEPDEPDDSEPDEPDPDDASADDASADADDDADADASAATDREEDKA